MGNTLFLMMGLDYGKQRVLMKALLCKLFHLCRGNRNVSLVVSWNLIPDAGMLPLISGGHFSIPFPDKYQQ